MPLEKEREIYGSSGSPDCSWMHEVMGVKVVEGIGCLGAYSVILAVPTLSLEDAMISEGT